MTIFWKEQIKIRCLYFYLFLAYVSFVKNLSIFADHLEMPPGCFKLVKSILKMALKCHL